MISTENKQFTNTSSKMLILTPQNYGNDEAILHMHLNKMYIIFKRGVSLCSEDMHLEQRHVVNKSLNNGKCIKATKNNEESTTTTVEQFLHLLGLQ